MSKSFEVSEYTNQSTFDLFASADEREFSNGFNLEESLIPTLKNNYYLYNVDLFKQGCKNTELGPSSTTVQAIF